MSFGLNLLNIDAKVDGLLPGFSNGPMGVVILSKEGTNMLKESSGIPLDLDDPFVRIRNLILPHGQIADGVQFQLLLIAGKFRHLRQSIELLPSPEALSRWRAE